MTFPLNFNVQFFHDYDIRRFRQNNHLEWVPAKFLILVQILIQELLLIKEKSTNAVTNNLKVAMLENSDLPSSREAPIVFEKFNSHFILILVRSHELSLPIFFFCIA